MKTAEDFRRAIGPADPDFQAAVGRALTALKDGQTAPKKRRIGPIIAIALLLLLSSTAYAASVDAWGIASFFKIWQEPILPEGEAMLQQPFIQNGGHDAPLVDFQVRQAVHDGCHLILYIEAVPKVEGLFLADTGVPTEFDESGQPIDPEDILSVKGLRREIFGEGIFQVIPLRQHLQETGQALALISLYGDPADHTRDWLISHHISESFCYNPDGSYGWLYRMDYPTDAEEITYEISCRYLYYTPETLKAPLAPQDMEQKADSRWSSQLSPLTVTVKTNPPPGAAHSAAPVRFEESGVTLERLTVQGTPFEISAVLDWRWDRPQTGPQPSGIAQAYLTSQPGYHYYWSIWYTDDARTTGREFITFPAQDPLPDRLYVMFGEEMHEVPLVGE